MTSIQIGLLVFLCLLFVASGFLSGSETSVVAIPRERLPQLEGRGRRGHRLALLASDPEATIGTILVANNFVNILATSIATVLAVDLMGESLGPIVATFVVTAIVLVAGEITPKTLASRHPESYGLAVATILWYVVKLLAPVSRVFRVAGNAILRLFGAHDQGARPVTEADVVALARLGEATGQIEQVEREIIHSVFVAADRPVRDVMTPRVDVVGLSLPLSMAQVETAIAHSGHSRYPVIEHDGDLDQIVGVLIVKDLLRAGSDPSPQRIRRLLRPPHFVPESATLLDVLQDLRNKRLGLGFVLDEHGGVEGVVTIKNIIAELVGELQDEYDPGSPAAVPIGHRRWEADGSLPVDELGEAIGIPLPVEGPYTSIGGLFMFLTGSIPDEGDQTSIDGIRITIKTMDARRIARVLVEIL